VAVPKSFVASVIPDSVIGALSILFSGGVKVAVLSTPVLSTKLNGDGNVFTGAGLVVTSKDPTTPFTLRVAVAFVE